MAFIDTLIDLRNGGAAIELEAGLEQVVEAVRKTGKSGKLTLVLSVKPADKGPDIDTVFLQDVIKVDAPKPDKKLTLFFANALNQLSRRDNRQFNMLDGLQETDIVESKEKQK
jgi:hypothetical protein